MKDKVIYKDEKEIKALTGTIIHMNKDGFLVLGQNERTIHIPVNRVIKIEQGKAKQGGNDGRERQS